MPDAQSERPRRGLVKLADLPDLTSQLATDLTDLNDPDLDPATIAAGSPRKLWWRCSEGPDHVWEAAIASRARLGRGCPCCAGQRVSVTNSLESLHPDIAAQVHPTLNDSTGAADVLAYGKAKLWWQCPTVPSHTWQAIVQSRTRNGTGCPACAGIVAASDTSLAAVNPGLASQLADDLNGGITAHDITRGSKKRLWWRCPEGADHTWQATIYRRSAGDGCPFCANRRASSTNNLEARAPELAREYLPELNGGVPAKEVAATTDTPVVWKCSTARHASWTAAPGVRYRTKTGCPTCAGKHATPDRNLASIYPEIAAEFAVDLNAETASSLTPASSHVVWWRCQNDPRHAWQAGVGTRTSTGRGCPFCAGKAVDETNSLAGKHPDLTAQYDNERNPIPASDLAAGSNRLVWWRCLNGHQWQARVFSRTAHGNGCPDCRLVARSAIEIRVESELAVFIPLRQTGDRAVNALGKCWYVDMICDELGIIIEYDGSFWHRNTIARDRYKTRGLEQAGWDVIRIRTGDLSAITANDVTVSDTAGPSEVAATVLARVAQMRPGRLDVDLVRAYAASGVALAADRADQELVAARRARLTHSIG